MDTNTAMHLDSTGTDPIDPEIMRNPSNDNIHATFSNSQNSQPSSSSSTAGASAPTDAQGNIDLSYVTETSARTDLHALQIAASLVNKKVAAAQAAAGHSAGHASAIDLDLSHSNPSSISNIQQQIEEVLGIQHSGTDEASDRANRTSVEAAAISSVASNPHVQAAYTRYLSEALSRSSNNRNTNQASTPQFYHETFRLQRSQLPVHNTRTLGMPVTAGEHGNYISTAAAAVEAARGGLDDVEGSQGVGNEYHHQMQSHLVVSDRQNEHQSSNVTGNERSNGSLGGQRHHQADDEPSFQTMNSINNMGNLNNMTGMLTVNLSNPGSQSQSSSSNVDEPILSNGRRRHRHKWSDQETSYLIEGCRTHGVGNWKKILMDPKFQFKSRTAVDLKDRFRTSFPEEYARLYPNAQTHKSTRKQFPVEGSELRKINRKERRRFTPAEDENLLKGFMKYGAAWSKIQRDKEFNLGERRSTDLRDRFRNAFPAQYALAGFKGRGPYALLSEVANAVDPETAAYLRNHKTVQSAGDTVRMVLNGNMSVDDAAATASAAAAYQQNFKSDLAHPDAYPPNVNNKSYNDDDTQSQVGDENLSTVQQQQQQQKHDQHGQEDGNNNVPQVQGAGGEEEDEQSQSTYPVYSGNLSPTLKAAAEAFAQSNLMTSAAHEENNNDVNDNDQNDNEGHSIKQERAEVIVAEESVEGGQEEEEEEEGVVSAALSSNRTSDQDQDQDHDDVNNDDATQEEVMASIKIGSIGAATGNVDLDNENGNQQNNGMAGDVGADADNHGGVEEMMAAYELERQQHEHEHEQDREHENEHEQPSLLMTKQEAQASSATIDTDAEPMGIGSKRSKPDSDQDESQSPYKKYR